MNNKEDCLRDFGYQFLGPICSEYFFHLRDTLETHPQSPILFLAREGYFFEQAYQKLVQLDLMPEHQSHYLLASRTFLFRITVADPPSWQYSLTHKFNGSLSKLLVGRFGFTRDVIAAIFSDEELAREYVLPDDVDQLTDVFYAHLNALGEAIRESRTAYFDYIRSLSLPHDQAPIMVDVGYAGTIQKLLTRLLGSDTHGLYFITTQQGEYSIVNKRAHIKAVFKDGVSMGDGYVMLDRSLFLEALLTSPQGQFIDIKNSETHHYQDFLFFFGRRAYTQVNHSELATVFDGAMQAIADYHKHCVRFDTAEIELLYEKYTGSLHFLPAPVRQLFDVDDAISGNGNVKPISLFGL